MWCLWLANAARFLSESPHFLSPIDFKIFILVMKFEGYLHLLHLRFPPVPLFRLRFSMLLPSVHFESLWYTLDFSACQGFFLAIIRLLS